MNLNIADFNQMRIEADKRCKLYGENIYHYTSFSAFKSMMDSGEIWLANTGSMNDCKENINFIEMIENALGNYKIKHDFFEKIYKKIPENYQYAFCMSKEKDDAAQWERYGDSANGVCLVINVKNLYYSIYGYDFLRFNEIFYDIDVKSNAYFKLIKEYFESGIVDVYSDIDELITKLMTMANFHKHISFKNEQEIRLSAITRERKCGEFKFVEKDGVLRKVFVLKLDEIGLDKGVSFRQLLDGIIIGPKSQQDLNVLEEYLGTKKMEISVTKSQCPLR